MGTIGEDGRGLRLTFISPRLNDSGMYVCSAFNQFEKVQSTVNLAVFPPGRHLLVKVNLLYSCICIIGYQTL